MGVLLSIASIQDWISMGLNNTKLHTKPHFGRMDSDFGSGLDRLGSGDLPFRLDRMDSGFDSGFDRWGSGDLPFRFDRMDSGFDSMGSGFDSGFDGMDSGFGSDFDLMGSGF